jgi:phosphoribosylanthranilate isomerase
MSPTRIKICGITTVDDALLAARLGVHAIGFNFCPASKRFIDTSAARPIIDVLPPFVDSVGLIVNESLARAGWLTRQLPGITTVQWHGDNPELPRADVGWRYIPAFAVKDMSSLSKVMAFLKRCRAAGSLPAAVLLDGHARGQYGGTGQTAPWQLLADFDPGVPVILAGGLTPGNVAEAIRIVHPFAVDVASGVESAPGRKDADKLRRFVDAVGNA